MAGDIHMVLMCLWIWLEHPSGRGVGGGRRGDNFKDKEEVIIFIKLLLAFKITMIINAGGKHNQIFFQTKKKVTVNVNKKMNERI